MEGLRGIISNLGQNNNWQKLLTGGMAGAGEIGNILEQRKRLAYQNFIMSILKNPQMLAQMAAKLQKPLDAGLTQGVTNQVQGDMAQRGLSQAPGIFAASESQALAPYYQQNQQTAMNAVLQSLGMPAGTFGAPGNNSGALSLFLKQFGKGGGSTDSTDTGFNIGPPIAPPETTPSPDPTPWQV